MRGRIGRGTATWQWLRRRFGRQAPAVARAWRQALDPESERGRLVLADLAALCHGASTTFVPGDPQETAFNEGKRCVLLHVLAVLGLSMTELEGLEPAGKE